MDLGLTIDDFLLTREGLDAARRRAGPTDWFGPARDQTLCLVADGDLFLGVYLLPDTLTSLSRHDPFASLTEENLAPFCRLAEETSHFVYLACNFRRGQPVTLLELELQGGVDTYVAAVYLSGRRTGALRMEHLFARLFDTCRIAPEVPASRVTMYEEAHRLARAFCAALARRYISGGDHRGLVRTLRDFYHRSQHEKVSRIYALALS